MKREPFQLPVWAARGAIAGAAFIFSIGYGAVALAQEEPDPEEEAAPAESQAAEPTEADPADAPAPTEGTAIDPETLDVVPVTEEAEAEVQADTPSGDQTQLDTIEVTGSRIKRTDYETAQPIVVIRREDIERTGLTNIGDILQRLPAAGSALNRTFNNGGAGTTEIDLRNLGSNRVLVLVNGQRWVNGTSFANTSAVDLNTIPVSIIERIEVLKDGASAIYGSDAIAGVVNIVTRKDVVGAELGGQFQSFDDGKGLIQNYHVNFGTVAGKTSMFVDFNFVSQSELLAGDRAQSSVPKYGTGHTRGSIHLPKGFLVFIPNAENESILAPLGLCPDIVVGPTSGLPLPPQSPGVRLCQMQLIGDRQTITPTTTTAQVAPNYKYVNLIPAGSEDYYNYAPVNYLLTPYDQQSVFGQVSHGLADWVNFTSQFFYSASKTVRQLADTPVLYGDLTFPPFKSIYIDATNIYNPFDQDIGRHPGQDTPGDAVGVGPGTGIVTKRFTEFGPRILRRDVKTLFLKGAFDGSFDYWDRLFSYDMAYSYGDSKLTSTESGNINMERLKLGLGPAINCPSQANPNCVPVDFFSGEGSITPAMIDYLFYTAAAEATQIRQDISFNISTEFGELSNRLPYGLLSAPIGTAFGLQYRTEEFREQPDPFAEQGIGSGNLRKRTEGGYDVREAYVEFALPILSDKKWADELDLSLAGRFTEYTTFDPETTYKLGVRWKPIDDVLVRATTSTAFRAPAVTDLFLGATDSYPQQEDPCVETGGRTSGTDVDQNCDAEGVPDNAPQNSTQVLNRFIGNPDLEPELADTYTYGIVYSPTQIPDLNIYLDYFEIEIEDFIGFLGGQFILDSCYNRPAGSSRPDTCDFVERNQDGAISFIRTTSYNFPKFGTKGLDVAFDYILPVGEWLPAMKEFGLWKVAFDSQYLTKYWQCVATADGGEDCTDFQGTDQGDFPLPRFKANNTLEWVRDEWKASWTVRYIKGTEETCSDGFEPSLASLGLCSNPDSDLSDGTDDSTNKYDDIFYHNLQAGYSMPNWNTEIVFGVLNVLDQDPPASYSAFANSASSTLYETWGSRQPYLKLDVKF